MGEQTMNTKKKFDEPYFAEELRTSHPAASSHMPNVMFVDFLERLNGPAHVQIDAHQEALIMMLRSRCVKYAMSDDTDLVIAALNQLCAFYHQGAIKSGLKAFEVFGAQNEEYIKVQEQFFYSRHESRAEDQRPVKKTNNLLVHAHDLLEGLIRRLATLGTFSIDVIRGRDRAENLRPSQYVDLDLRTKEYAFREDPSILASTYDLLFGSARHDIRNAIAHKRYEIREDGSVLLFDFDPRKQLRKDVGELSQSQLETLISALERAADIFEMSVLIFQHNNGSILHQLGYYEPKKAAYTEKEVREMIYLNATACFMRIDAIEIINDEVIIDASFFSFENERSGGEAFVNSKDKRGNPFKYRLPLKSRELSARDQTFRLLQVASLYCQRYSNITVRTKDILSGKPLGQASASLKLLERSLREQLPKEEFLQQLAANTFSHD